MEVAHYLPENTVLFVEKDNTNAYQLDNFKEFESFFPEDYPENLLAVAFVENPNSMILEEIKVFDDKSEIEEGFVFQKAGLIFQVKNEDMRDWLKDYKGSSLSEKTNFKKVKRHLPKGFMFAYLDFDLNIILSQLIHLPARWE